MEPIILFQSTPPEWGATATRGDLIGCIVVSIHAPRVGSDFLLFLLFLAYSQFQSTPPEWGATYRVTIFAVEARFQSTPPEWGATPLMA